MRICLALISFILVPTLMSQEPAKTPEPTPDSPYVEREERQFNFFPGGKIAISLEVPGSLKVVGWQKGSVRIEAEKIVYYGTEESAKAFLKKSPIRLRYTQTGSTLQVTGVPEPPAILEVNLTVYLPGEKTDVVAKIDKGEFSITNVNGWVETTIKEGSLEAKSMSGYFSGRILRGDILVDMTNDRWNGLEFAAATYQGSATLLLPEKYSAALQLETRNGKITVDYPPRVLREKKYRPKLSSRKQPNH